MKKFMVMLLAAAMALSLVSLSVLARDDDDDDPYDNQEIFSIKENTGTLYPGVDYYFECEWQGGDITDDFFEFYTVSVSASSADGYDRDDDDNGSYVSSSAAKKIAEVAEFVKLDGQDKYYFHFRAKKSYNYPDEDEVTFMIRVLAKDKSRSSDREDSRSWYDMELDIGYADKNDTRIVENTEHEVDNDRPIVEFDEDLDYCRLIFEDGSYYNIRLEKVRKYNLGQSTDENTAIANAYPNAKLKFVSFYSQPKFASESVLKVYAPGCEYLYEIGENNRLKLLVNDSNDGYIGYTTDELLSYVASDVPLDSSSVSVNSGDYVNAAVTAPAAGSQSAAAPAPAAPSTVIITNPNTGAHHGWQCEHGAGHQCQLCYPETGNWQPERRHSGGCHGGQYRFSYGHHSYQPRRHGFC